MKLFKYASLMLAMFAAVSFVSCGSDSDEEDLGNGGTNVSINMKDLYGIWEPIYVKYTYEEDGEVESYEGKITNGWPSFWGEDDRDSKNYIDGFFRVELLENGSLKYYTYLKGQWILITNPIEEGLALSYSVNGDVLTTEDSEGEKSSSKIIKLDNSTMMIQESTQNEPGYKYWGQVTYKKVE